jgi:hypothetical protein
MAADEICTVAEDAEAAGAMAKVFFVYIWLTIVVAVSLV